MPVLGKEVKVQGMSQPAVLNEDGMYFYGNDGKKVYTCTRTFVDVYVHVHVHMCLHPQATTTGF